MNPRSTALLWPCVLAALLLACSAEESGTTLPPPSPDGGPVDAAPSDAAGAARPASVDTLGPSTVRAGQPMGVHCQLLDAAGNVVSAPAGATPTITYAPPASVRDEGGNTVGVRAGTVTVTCAFPTLGLTDSTPARVTITAGDAARVTTTLDRSTIAAGESARATCTVTDAYGNPLPDARPTLRLDPMGMGATLDGLSARIERAGMYTASCVLPGATGDGAALTVTPALPASLVISRLPDQPLYARGQTVEVRATVSDRFGNQIPDAPLSFVSAPAATATMVNRFTYGTEGAYTVTVRVTGMTEGGRALVQTTSFTVDSSGPTIECAAPLHAAMIDAAPGSTLTFQARLGDASGVGSVTINGQAVTPAGNGTVSRPITVRWGINFVDVRAVDTHGIENSRTCAFLVSDLWNPERNALAEAVGLSLRQDAVDDGNPTAPITSIDDVLQRVVNSAGLATQLDTTLRAANPIKPYGCDQTVLGVCIFHSRVDYLDSVLGGPHTTALTLVDGGLRANVHFQDVRVRLHISGTLSTTGWINVASVDVGLIFNLSSAGGRPTATVRPGSVGVTVGRISTDFSGLTGAIVDVVVSLANGTVRNLVSNALRDYVSNNFSRVLDGVLSGIDISSLGATFNVPRLDGAAATALRFGVNVSSVNATTARARFGLGTLLSTATPAHSRPTLGIALPPGLSAESTISTPATVGVQVAVLNQALHALWRGGWLNVTLPTSRFTTLLPDGARFEVNGLLPPVAFLRDDGRINLDLGALEIAMVIPGAAPFQISLGARATGSITLMGNSLRFGGVTLDELHVSIVSESISMMERDALNSSLRMLAQQYVERSLNDALPAIPVPAFTIPASLGSYGLPVGAELGIRAPALASSHQRFELRGGFGQR